MGHHYTQLKTLASSPFEKAFPDCQAVFFFDCAKNPTDFAADALRDEKMNLSCLDNMKDGYSLRGHPPLTESASHARRCYADGKGHGKSVVCGDKGPVHPLQPENAHYKERRKGRQGDGAGSP
jgi:hypothetical protein